MPIISDNEFPKFRWDPVTSMPSSPTVGQHVYRSDIRGGTVFVWNGTRWWSEQEYQMDMGDGLNHTASYGFYYPIPHDVPIRCTAIDWVFYSSGTWSCELKVSLWDESSYPTITGSTQSTASHTAAKWYGYTLALDFAIDGTGPNSGTNHRGFSFSCTRTSGNTYADATLHYRLTAT